MICYTVRVSTVRCFISTVVPEPADASAASQFDRRPAAKAESLQEVKREPETEMADASQAAGDSAASANDAPFVRALQKSHGWTPLVTAVRVHAALALQESLACYSSSAFLSCGFISSNLVFVSFTVSYLCHSLFINEHIIEHLPL